MNENQLVIELRKTIIDGLASAGITGAEVKQSYQPQREGINSGPTIYLHKLADHRHGSPYSISRFDEVEEEMVHTYTQVMETTYQVNALVKRDITNPNQMTAVDIVNAVAIILSTEASISYLNTKEIGILRITDVTNPFFLDDADQNESSPSFDVVLTYNKVLETIDPVATTIESAIHRV